ncbi:MAG: 3-deoxy-manno-octulosonate cytidylyltransferase [Bacteroidales bacterium]|nr:3-deoxy-manno-octulosonate cytidylyltransferase [Bacteroidales bacterium]
MNIAALIPARYASTRLPGKPLAIIGSKPMIQWVYERVNTVFEHTYVATDDERIAQAVGDFGGRYVLTSPDARSGTDRCAEAINTLEHNGHGPFDVVINIQGDEPFISTEPLRCVAAAFEQPQVDIATLVKRFGSADDIFSPNTPKVVLNLQGEAIYFSRSVIPHIRGMEPELWQHKHLFYKHIGLYAYRANVLRRVAALPQSALERAESLEQLRWIEHGLRIKAIETDVESLAVDTPADLERARAEASRLGWT